VPPGGATAGASRRIGRTRSAKPASASTIPAPINHTHTRLLGAMPAATPARGSSPRASAAARAVASPGNTSTTGRLLVRAERPRRRLAAERSPTVHAERVVHAADGVEPRLRLGPRERRQHREPVPVDHDLDGNGRGQVDRTVDVGLPRPGPVTGHADGDLPPRAERHRQPRARQQRLDAALGAVEVHLDDRLRDPQRESAARVDGAQRERDAHGVPLEQPHVDQVVPRRVGEARPGRRPQAAVAERVARLRRDAASGEGDAQRQREQPRSATARAGPRSRRPSGAAPFVGEAEQRRGQAGRIVLGVPPSSTSATGSSRMPASRKRSGGTDTTSARSSAYAALRSSSIGSSLTITTSG
jgi:hypothetical protein